jgi:hypothetical protein
MNSVRFPTHQPRPGKKQIFTKTLPKNTRKDDARDRWRERKTNALELTKKIATNFRCVDENPNQLIFASRFPKAASSAAMSSLSDDTFEDFERLGEFALVICDIFVRAQAESF